MKRRKQYTYVEKRRAHAAVWKAVRQGRLTPKPCEVCLSTHRVVAHHHDYGKPLRVRWLCALHHNWVHRWGEPDKPRTVEECRASLVRLAVNYEWASPPPLLGALVPITPQLPGLISPEGVRRTSRSACARFLPAPSPAASVAGAFPRVTA